MSKTHNVEDTADFVTGQRFSDAFFARSPPPFSFAFGAATHPGHVRPNNEDHYAVVKRRRTSELLLTNLDPQDVTLADDSAYALIVADGMGGARFGEFASRLALQRMFEMMHHATSWVMKYTNQEVLQIRERVDAYVQEIQATLRDYIDADPSLAGMGTTWTSAHLLPPHALVVHIGDSRAYLLHDGQLRQVTHDETMAQAFIDTGMNPADVRRFRHILINSLGGEKDRVDAQIHHFEMALGDRLLLCTDGLTEMVADKEIVNVLEQTPVAQDACERLIALALDNGGKDNVTALLAVANAPEP
jgi:PPM family protein phosphatase